MAEFSTFKKNFSRWSGRVRRRLRARSVLTGLSAGLVVGALFALGAWRTRHGDLRRYAAGAGAIGALVGLAISQRKRWHDDEVALYLDGRLGTEEVVTTALEMGPEAEGAGHGVVVSQAIDALEQGDPKRVRPNVFRPWHVAIPLAAAAIGYVAVVPLPPQPVVKAAPGSDQVKLSNIEGLEKIEALEKLPAEDDAQRERLKKIAEDAKKLRKKLLKGMERRKAQDELARIQDAIAKERLRLGSGKRRQGLEAALSALAKNPKLRGAAKHLANQDLVHFDKEMQRLANTAEKKDRDAAKKALEEAEKAARDKGNKALADALRKQRELLEVRGKRADLLRKLGESMDKHLSRHDRKLLKRMQKGGGGTNKDARDLAKSLNDVLKRLTPEEREALAKKLGEMGVNENQPKGSGGKGQDLKDLAKRLNTPEGQKELAEQLKRFSEMPPRRKDLLRERGLNDAQKGAGKTRKQLGMGLGPNGMPRSGRPGGKKPGAGGKKPGSGSKPGGKPGGQPGPGGHNDKGKGNHKGSTNKVNGGRLRSRANSKLNGGAPSGGISVGRTAGRAGETANRRGTGALGKVGPGEVNGINESQVPEEYREQVGRYFQPLAA